MEPTTDPAVQETSTSGASEPSVPAMEPSSGGGAPVPEFEDKGIDMKDVAAQAMVSMGQAAEKRGLGTGISEAAAEAAPAPAPSFPSADEFGWDEFDGDFEKVPELVRPWLSTYHDRTVPNIQKELEQARLEAQTNRRLYEALDIGAEDPRVAEYQAKNQDLQAALEAERERMEDLVKYRDEQVKLESERYFQEFNSKYEKQLADPTVKAGVEKIVFDTIPDADQFKDWDKTMIEPNEAIQIAVYGDDAIALGLELASEQVPVNRIVQLVKAEFGTASARTRTPPKNVVAGSSGPVPTPAPRAPKPTPVTGWSDLRAGNSKRVHDLAARLAG